MAVDVHRMFLMLNGPTVFYDTLLGMHEELLQVMKTQLNTMILYVLIGSITLLVLLVSVI